MNMTVLEVCGIIAIIGGAVGYLYKGYKALTKPHEEITNKLDNDYEDIKELKEELTDLKKEIDELKQGLGICLQAINQLLEHNKTGNNTGGMQRSQDEIFDFLNY